MWQVWKDVRIHPEYGTVETRIADSMPSLIDTIAVATLFKLCALRLEKEWENGKLDRPTPTWLIESNRWAAIKEGLGADFITDLSGETKPISLVIRETVDSISPIAERLGSLENLSYVDSVIEKSQVVETMREIAAENLFLRLFSF